MLYYAAVYGAEQGIGHGEILAVVGSDGQSFAVHGEGPVADDLRDVARQDGAPTGDARGMIAWVTRGMDYFTVAGPHQFDGDLGDLAPVAAAHGL